MASEDILDAEEGRYYCYINLGFVFNVLSIQWLLYLDRPSITVAGLIFLEPQVHYFPQ